MTFCYLQEIFHGQCAIFANEIWEKSRVEFITLNFRIMIKSTNLRPLWSLEFFQVVSNILVYLKGYKPEEEKPEDAKISPLVTELEEGMKVLDAKLVVARGNALTEKLLKADASRDVAFRGFYNSLKLYESFPETEKTDAAVALLKEINKYGKDIDRMNYAQESGALNNLLQDLAEEKNAALIGLLHVEDWLEKLKTAQTEFDALFVSRESENAGKQSGDVREARSAVQDMLDRLGKMINACELVYGAEAYAPVCEKVNEAVTYGRQQAARHPGRKPKEDSNKENKE